MRSKSVRERQEIEELQQLLERRPRAVAARKRLLELLGHSDINSDTEIWLTHCKWWIKNRPSDPIFRCMSNPKSLSDSQIMALYRCWKSAIANNPEKSGLVGLAGQFFLYRDCKRAAKLLKQAEDLEPRSQVWSRYLFLAYIQTAELEDYKPEALRRVFEQGDKALLKERHPGEKQGLLVRLTNLALKFNELTKAKAYATSMLKLAIRREISFREFISHNYLGLVTLKQGNISEAESELMLSAQCEFFSDVGLAQELLALDRREVVQEFLDVCAARAANDELTSEYRRSLNKYAAEMRQGKIPSLKFRD